MSEKIVNCIIENNITGLDFKESNKIYFNN